LSGALSKAESAVKSAESANKMLVEKERKAGHMLQDVDKIFQKAQVAGGEAQVYNKLLTIKASNFNLFKSCCILGCT